MIPEFTNVDYTDFSQPETKEAMEKAIAAERDKLGGTYPLIIGGERITTDRTTTVVNPSDVDEVLGEVSRAGTDEVDRAMEAAWRAFDEWKRVPAEARARIMWKAAALLERRRLGFDALEVLEGGKNWAEADADVAEAIDFLNFYASQMVRMAERQPLTRVENVDNELDYIPLGVGVIIPPWNFLGAIMIGMTSAAVVTGNTTLLKPASNTPIIAHRFVELMEEAGLPEGVINYLPGSGGEIGDHLVEHPRTRFVSFTGSRDVGVRIYEKAARVQEDQIWLKRVVAEMGGKDAIVVDAEADLEAAASGIVTSAFGFQGQKCSACSRAILHRDIYDEVLERIVELTEELEVGPAEEDPDVAAVIDEEAKEKILGYIEIGRGEGRLMTGGGEAPGNGHYIEPTVFADVDSQARIAQEEIFGPVLAVIKAEDFDDAIRIANDTEYGLTGSVYSRNRLHLEQAREEFHVGNLYFNRKCTGALVDVEPFGGFNMSGTDSKAGGRDYLLHFLQAKSISETL